MRVARALPIAAVVLAACGTEHLEQIVDATAAPPIDGGLPDAETLAIAEPVPPIEPAAPAMPERAQSPVSPQCVACVDPPNVDASNCSEDEVRFPSSDACERIGSACPVGQWADDLPADQTIVYVDPLAPPGGDGSMTAPFITIAEARAVAPVGSIIALAKGEIEEAIVLDDALTLWGACTSMTHLHSSSVDTTSGVITVRNTGAVIKNLRISGERPAIYTDDPLANFQVQDVIVDGASLFAIFIHGAGVQARFSRVVVKNTNSLQGTGNYGDGINVGDGAMADLVQVVVSRSRAIGVSISGPDTEVRLLDSVISDTRGVERDGTLGFGIWLIDGLATVQYTVLERNRGAMIVEQGASPSLYVQNVVVRDPLASDALPGWGLWMVGVPTATVSGMRVEHAKGTAVRLGENVRALFDNIVVYETEPDRTGFVSAFQIDGGAQVSIGTSAFYGIADHAIRVDGPGTRVVLNDLNSVPWMNHDSGGLLRVGNGASVSARRVRAASATIGGVFVDHAFAELEDLVVGDSGYAAIAFHGEMNIRRMGAYNNRWITLALAWPDARGVFEDITIDDTQADATGRLGRGVSIEVGAHATIKRALLRRNHNSAIYSGYGGANVTIEDLTVEDTDEEPATGFGGQALLADRNGFIDVTRAAIRGSTNLGIVLTGSSAISARDLLLADTKPGPMGYGIGFDLEALDGFAGRASVTRAIFDNNTLASVVCSGRGEQLSLTDVVVKNTQPGSRGEYGRGVVILSGGHAFMERALLEANREIGLQVALDRASLEATDLVIRVTTSNTNGVYGRGMSIELSASATIARARIEHNDEIGIAIAFDRSSVKATDLVVSNTQTIDCPPTACTVTQGGYGVAAYGAASFVAERFLIADNAVVGLTIGDGGTADLSLGEISGNRLGVNIDTNDFDVARLSDRVVYRNNERDLDANQLPVPESTNPLPPPMMH